MAIEKNNESLEEQIVAQDTNVDMEPDAPEEPLVQIDQEGNAVEVLRRSCRTTRRFLCQSCRNVR
jgi:hypothetical protein